jgi:uncharacterized protein (TIGR02996 family)
MDEAALWQAIHDAPADERAWLVMADWLEEHDDPLRAELFRITLALRLRSDEAHRLALEARQRELLAAGVRPAVPEVVNSVGMRLALIPAGTFWMGSTDFELTSSGAEGPRHEVELTRPYYLGVFAVTQEQFQRVLGNNPSHFCASGEGRKKVKGLDSSTFPVDSVTWNRAVTFCRKLSTRPEEKKAGRVYRLPTEAEWEHACRAGAADAPFHFGASLSSRQANFNGKEPSRGAPQGPYLSRTCPVGSYPPNAFGLYDMHGNVAEHCHDWGGENYPDGPRKDPQGPGPSHTHVLRGGSWGYSGRSCRTASRDGISPRGRNAVVGFRVACVLASWRG